MFLTPHASSSLEARRPIVARSPSLGEPNACFVVSVHSSSSATLAAAQLAETVGLVQAQGDRVVGQLSYELVRPDPKTLLRKGVAASIADQARPARNRPLETLETTSRCLTRHGGDVLVSDTVGFIRRLPEKLFASFESFRTRVRSGRAS